MTVLLSIKPEFAYKIFDGTKKYEFRKSIFKPNVKDVLVYASSPVQRVIGEFKIEDILCDGVDEIWEITKKHSGITKDFYNEYFKHKEQAYAIKVGSTKQYKEGRLLKDYNVRNAPQSFIYLEKGQ